MFVRAAPPGQIAADSSPIRYSAQSGQTMFASPSQSAPLMLAMHVSSKDCSTASGFEAPRVLPPEQAVVGVDFRWFDVVISHSAHLLVSLAREDQSMHGLE